MLETFSADCAALYISNRNGKSNKQNFFSEKMEAEDEMKTLLEQLNELESAVKMAYEINLQTNQQRT